MSRQFDPETDVVLLRECLHNLFRLEGKKLATLVTEVAAYCAKRKGPDGKPLRRSISRSSLQTYLASKSPTFGNMGFLRGIWEYLSQHPDYSRYLPAQPSKEELVPVPLPDTRPIETVLSAVLTRFLSRERLVGHLPFESITARLPGRYIMYRADLRPYATGAEVPERFRVSPFTISMVDEAVCLREEQDYPADDYEGPFRMATSGVAVPYGRYIIFLMQAEQAESFRTIVITDIFPFVEGIGARSLRGMFLVASQVAMFPATPFYCLRDDDGKLQTGKLTLDQIPDVEARAFLRNAHAEAKLHFKNRTVIKP